MIGTGARSSRRRSNFEQLCENECQQTTVIGPWKDGIPDDADSQKHMLSEAENLKVYVTSEITINSAAAS
jgi:hypothetical protein